jgi:hypothetical protein
VPDVLVISETEQIVQHDTLVELVDVPTTEVLTEEGPGEVLEVAGEVQLLQTVEAAPEYLEHGSQELVEVAEQGPPGPPGTGTALQETRTNADAATILAGQAIYATTATDARRAIANGSVSSRVFGLAMSDMPPGVAALVQLDAVMELTVAQWEAATGLAGPLAAGQPYFLSDTVPGGITPFPPSADGSYVAPVGVAITGTKFLIDVDTRIRI